MYTVNDYSEYNLPKEAVLIIYPHENRFLSPSCEERARIKHGGESRFKRARHASPQYPLVVCIVRFRLIGEEESIIFTF